MSSRLLKNNLTPPLAHLKGVAFGKVVSTSIVVCALFIFCFGQQKAFAGFVEMPKTSEVPNLEKKSLLLDMDIPAVRDRDPNPESGPRLNVKEFRVQGLMEFPEFGISRAEISKQIEAIRFDLMEEKKLKSGYSPEEIAEVSDLISQIEEETEGRHVGPVEVQRLVFLMREQRRKRGVTLGMVEEVADTVTRYYRERGFILAKAYIPQQHVRDGVVTITLMLGQLGEVEVKNNKRYSEKLISRIFNHSLAKPVTNDAIEEDLYLVNDYPGLSVQGYFEPGSQVGDTKLNVNVVSEKRFSANARVDNHGSDKTGEYRLYADSYANNLLGIGDALQLGVLASFVPESAAYGSFRFSAPIYSPRLLGELGVSSNEFTTKGGLATGNSLVLDSLISYKLVRSRKSNHSISLGFSNIQTQIDFGATNTIVNYNIDKDVDKLDLGYQFDVISEKKRVLHQGSIMVTAANVADIPTKSLTGKPVEVEEDSSQVISFDYSRLSFIPLPFSEKEAKWVFRTSGQYAGGLLSGVLQFNLAGPVRSRGFSSNQIFPDDAIYVGSDLILPGPALGGKTLFNQKIQDAFQPFVFADVGYGKNYPLAAAVDDANVISSMADIGVGLKVKIGDALSGNISLAVPVYGKSVGQGGTPIGSGTANTAGSDTEKDDKLGDGAKLYFDFQYRF